MTSRKIVWDTTAAVALGELVCCGIMVLVFLLLGKFDKTVIFGTLAGYLIAVANFFVMALCADLAADKSQKDDVKGGQALVQMSYMGRLAVLFLLLILCAKSGIFHLIALVLPLIFVRPVLTIRELILKKRGNSV